MILKVIEKCIIFIFILLNCYYIKYVTNNWGYFYNEKYTYVRQFPKINSAISGITLSSSSSNKEKCEQFKNLNLKKCTGKCESFSNTCTKIADKSGEIIQKAPSSNIAFCKYISYWFYNTLKSTESHSYFELLEKFYNEFENIKGCTVYHKKNNINEQVHGELKVLYELYDDFYNFITESSGHPKTECEHGTKCVKIYKQHVDKCKNKYENGLCINLIIFKKQYDEHIENMNTCHEKIQHLDSIESNIKSIIILPFVVMIVISIILLLLYKFTPFGSWIRPKLTGINKMKILEKKMQELQNTSENEGRQYKLPYNSPYS